MIVLHSVCEKINPTMILGHVTSNLVNDGVMTNHNGVIKNGVFYYPKRGPKLGVKKKHTSTGVTKADNFNYFAALERAETLHI